MRILLLISILYFGNVYSCEDVNLYKTRPEIFTLKIKNQGDMSTCYAHSLSTLYNLEVAKTFEDLINPYWIAMNHKNKILHWQPKDLDYSILSWAFKDLKKSGQCDNSIIVKSLLKLKNGVNYSDDQVMYLLKIFFKRKSFKLLRASYNFQKIIDETYSYVIKNSVEFEKVWLKEDVTKILQPLEYRSRARGLFSFLKYDLFNECSYSTRSISSDLRNFGRGFESNETVAKTLDQVLSSDKAVSLGYCTSIIFEKDPEAKSTLNISKKLLPRITRAVSGKCGAHYSVIVGSRNTGNSCDYLIRNSYGTGFWANKNTECWCLNKLTGKQNNCRKDNFDSKKQIVLGCWAEKQKLLNNTFDLSYFR